MPLEKMRIRNLDNNTSFEVLYNPQSYVQRKEAKYAQIPVLGADAPVVQFHSGAAETSGGKKAGLFNFSQWSDAQWKKMQRICIIICAVLVILIIISLATRKKGDDEVQEVIPTPIAEAVATPEIIVTPVPSDYPDAATKSEIAAANLEVFPEDTDYVDAEKTVTVSTSGSVLNLRRGPGSGYGQVGSMDNGTTLNVYAYKNGWALVKHNGTWGWCSVDYLK